MVIFVQFTGIVWKPKLGEALALWLWPIDTPPPLRQWERVPNPGLIIVAPPLPLVLGRLLTIDFPQNSPCASSCTSSKHPSSSNLLVPL